ncbi:MAG: acetyl-CoA C-acyltransferase [Candidatus Methylomirabilales bacterium]
MGKAVLIVSAARTPIGSLNGALGSLPAPRLGAVAIAETVRRACISPEEVQEVFMGNVVSAGIGQAPARQAAIYAGLPHTVGATTINKMCGSGLKAVMLAAQAIRLGEAEVIVAGGMESMTQTPYLLDRARTGYRMGHGKLIDSMIHDGLWDVYNDMHMGICGELCAERYDLSRDHQDEYAIQSYTRAREAQQQGGFKAEIVPVPVPGRKADVTLVEEDEEPKRVQLDKVRTLQPAFREGGTITAANASSVNDGAAAVVLTTAERARQLGTKPLGRVVAAASAALAPEWFTVAPATAVQRLLDRVGLRPSDVDLYEINEAFSSVALANMQILGLSPERVNVKGGAVALGHPIGASGARILTTLLYTMAERGVHRGIAAICLGGGEAVAVLVEAI